MAHIYSSRIIKPSAVTRRSMLLKGPSGTGKTYQFRCLVESGLQGLYINVFEHLGTLEGLDFDIFPIEKPDVPLALSDVRPDEQHFWQLLEWIKSGDHTYDFIFFDSLMMYAEKLLFYLQHERQPRLTGYDLWGAFGQKMKKALEELVGLTNPRLPKPVHVVATWGVEVSQDWEGKRAIVPIVDGKMVGPRIDYYFDDVFMLRKQPDEDGKIVHVAYTGGTHEFDAKVSGGPNKLPSIIKNPNLARILTYIKQNNGKESMVK